VAIEPALDVSTFAAGISTVQPEFLQQKLRFPAMAKRLLPRFLAHFSRCLPSFHDFCALCRACLFVCRLPTTVDCLFCFHRMASNPPKICVIELIDIFKLCAAVGINFKFFARLPLQDADALNPPSRAQPCRPCQNANRESASVFPIFPPTTTFSRRWQ